ncbi:MAG: glycoside hydrolase family 3 C-terminal domain-containing protein, partial [Rhodanobacteraceae bacterium]|nr:glycoside hydrolase family 3 C-terminal domain-containing protein [Rhodanobacteraceae bacterium]
FGKPLLESAKNSPDFGKRLRDMNQRIVRSILAVGLDTDPPVTGPIDFDVHAKVSRLAASKGIVLLRNQGVLPLEASKLRSMVIIGGYADSGVLSGGGSSQVHAQGGPSVYRPYGDDDRRNPFLGQQYHRSSPLAAIRALAPDAQVAYRRGWYLTDAVTLAGRSDVAIVFATQHMSEGFDLPDLSLPEGQDQLIAAVAAANPRTIVVLETGGPVLMPWLDKVSAVIEAWYPGIRGGEAIADILFGKVNPSGRLPITFPASEAQLPRPVLPGSTDIEPTFTGAPRPGEALQIDYDIEGADVGYRWYARQGLVPLFPFGFGLSYTTFAVDRLGVTLRNQQVVVTAQVRNTGPVAGEDVVQIDLTSAAGRPTRRLVGYQRVSLAPGESQSVSLNVDPRLLADWSDGSWLRKGGPYGFSAGRSSMDLGPTVTIALPRQRS